MRTLFIILTLVAAGAGAYFGLRHSGRTPQATSPPPGHAAVPTATEMPRVVGVDAVAKDPKAHAGRVGIEGVVADVFADRGAFTMIDCAEFEACGQTHCAEYSVPVQVPKTEYQGELPKTEEKVLVIGEVQPKDDGYRFVVEEVRRSGEVIVRRARR